MIDFGLFTSPGIAWDKTKDFNVSQLISLVLSCMCSMLISQKMMSIPLKNPILLMMICVCCISSSTSSAMIGTDTYHRFTR